MEFPIQGYERDRPIQLNPGPNKILALCSNLVGIALRQDGRDLGLALQAQFNDPWSL